MKFILSLLLPLVLFAYNNPMDKTGIFDPSVLEINQELYLGKKVGNYTLLTEKGWTNLQDISKGKPTILQLAYYTCDSACPVITENAIKSLKELDDKGYSFLVVSFDKRDNIESLRSYKHKLEEKVGRLEDNWTLALMSEEDIKKLTSELGFKFFYSEKDKTFVHPNVLVFISPNGVITRYLFGVAPRPQDIRIALANARIEKPSLTSIVDLALLACYRYDPTRSRYVFDPTVIFPLIGFALLATTGLLALKFSKKEV